MGSANEKLFSTLTKYKNIMITPLPPPPPQEKTPGQNQNDQQLIKHTNERQIVLLKILSIVISYNYPILENSFI